MGNVCFPSDDRDELIKQLAKRNSEISHTLHLVNNINRDLMDYITRLETSQKPIWYYICRDCGSKEHRWRGGDVSSPDHSVSSLHESEHG
jgi:hypothetical protein